MDADASDRRDYCSVGCSVKHNSMLPLRVLTLEQELAMISAASEAESVALGLEMMAAWEAKGLAMPIAASQFIAKGTRAGRAGNWMGPDYKEFTMLGLAVWAEMEAQRGEEFLVSLELPPAVVGKLRIRKFCCIQCSAIRTLQLQVYIFPCSTLYASDGYYCNERCREAKEPKCVSCQDKTVWIDPKTRQAAAYCSLDCVKKHNGKLPETAPLTAAVDSEKFK